MTDSTETHGVGMLVDTTKQIITLATAIIGAVLAAVLTHPPYALAKPWAFASLISGGVSIAAALLFAFYVAYASHAARGVDSLPIKCLIGTSWFFFLVSVLCSGVFVFKMG